MRDTELLECYLQCGSESAFTELVNRYIDLAYSVARRRLADPVLAEEVVQATFCLLARKARTLTEYDSLAGWVYRATCNISLKTLRDERLRRERERATVDMNDPIHASGHEQPWERLVPLLDEAFCQLRDDDRAALVLRFVQRKAMRDIAEALGTTEPAAKMRVGRAIQKLRQYFQERGLSFSSASLVTAMGALSADAAPAVMTGTILAAVSGHSVGTVFSGSLATVLMHMAKLKTKLAILGLGATAAVLTGTYVGNRPLNFLPRETPAAVNPEPDGTRQPQAPRTGAFSEQWTAKIRDFGLARAAAKLEAALNAPPRKGTRSYPSTAVERAVLSYGRYQDHAFPILKQAIEGENAEARLQAIAALGRIGKSVPEARPLLWELLKAGEDRASWDALSALGNIGFLPEEISNLAAMIPGQTDALLVRYLPEQIARAIQRDPEAMKPYLRPVEALLQNADPAVRFSGACALAELRGGQDPQIVRGLAAGLAVSDAYRLRNEATGENVRHLMAVETLQRLGPAAKAVRPELETFAKLTPDPVMRDLALRAIGAIDVEAGRDNPEIRSLVAKEEQLTALLDRLNAGTYSSEDLTQGLREPMAASLAAKQLAELGPAAKELLPDMHQALAGKDEATRDEILAAIRQIDPDYPVPRVSREPVAQGAVAARLELELQRSQGTLDDAAAATLEKLIDRFRMGNTSWYTAREVTEFARELQEKNPRLWEAFRAETLKSAPGIAD